MSLPLFFISGAVLKDLALQGEFDLGLDRDDGAHFRVLRIKAGEHIAVVDDQGDYCECEVIDPSPAQPVVRVTTKRPAQTPLFSLTLAQGLTKGDKMDMVVRHATEVGVDRFVPFSCQRSVVRWDDRKAAQKVERWQKIARSAAMQSGRHQVPQVCGVCRMSNLDAALQDADVLLVFWEEASLDQTISACLSSYPLAVGACLKVALIVGPEGGLSKDEVARLLDTHPHAHAVTLGDTILRTETAGIVAPALVRYELSR